MQKRKKDGNRIGRGGLLLLLCVLTIVLVPNTAAQAKSKNQGKAGRSSTWTYQPKNRTLTITGKGSVDIDDLRQWDDDDEGVWLGKEDAILPMFRKIIFREGITEIDQRFFCLENVTMISLPASLQKINNDGFNEYDLEEINGAYDPWSTTLRTIKVSKKSKKFKARGSVLFSKDGKTLYVYPTGRSAKKYRIPGKVTKIGNNAFMGADIRKIVLGNRVTVIGKQAFQDSTVREVIFGKRLSKIMYCAFENCSLSKVNFPSSLTSIATGAFYGCPITELVIPAKVTKIGYQAFAKNKKLQKIVIQGNSYIEEEAFEDVSCYKDEKKNVIHRPITVVLGRKMSASLNALCESLGNQIQFEVESGNTKYYVKEGTLYTVRGDLPLYQPKKEEVKPSPAPAATAGTAQ